MNAKHYPGFSFAIIDIIVIIIKLYIKSTYKVNNLLCQRIFTDFDNCAYMKNCV